MNILVIPDTQVKEGVNTDHIEALGHYAVKHQPEVIVHLGDHFDMYSLNVYDKGKMMHKDANYHHDINAGVQALKRFNKPIDTFNQYLKKYKKKTYRPRKVFLLGNHEYRIWRHVQSNPILRGTLSYDNLQLKEHGWEYHKFLHIVDIEGIKFSHYFVNPDSAKKYPFSSGIDLQLQKLGFSFVQGHKQGLHTASPRYSVDGSVTRGIIAGSCYSHEEEYMGPQGNHHWRGALMLKHIDGLGYFTPIEIPLGTLLK